MIVLEPWARVLLVLHTVLAGVLVGSATHHLVSVRRYLAGRFARVDGERRFALLTAIFFVATFVVGNLLYPTYKVRVRVEYFDAPQSIAAEAQLRQAGSYPTVAPAGAHGNGPPPSEIAGAVDLAWVGRLFDVKEHWAALGAAAALALLALSRLCHPSRRPELAHLYVGLSLVVCASAWTGALVGLVTASYRAVGGVS